MRPMKKRSGQNERLTHAHARQKGEKNKRTKKTRQLHFHRHWTREDDQKRVKNQYPP